MKLQIPPKNRDKTETEWLKARQEQMQNKVDAGHWEVRDTTQLSKKKSSSLTLKKQVKSFAKQMEIYS